MPLRGRPGIVRHLASRSVAAPLAIALTLLAAQPVAAAASSAGGEDLQTLRAWVQEMKESPRGPFRRIRWFCADGSVLPPRAYACKEHGGGVQHGELGERARALRERGFHVANVLAALDVPALLASPGHRQALAQILVERFLIRVDDGWILRKARFYRGAFQEQDERRAARELLLALLASDAHLARDYALVRAAARMLPHGSDTRSAGEIRQLSSAMTDRDRAFLDLRNKIHGRLGPEDADAVRAYARRVGDAALAADYERLADAIDALFAASAAADALASLAARADASGPLRATAQDAAARLRTAGQDPDHRYPLLAEISARLRDLLASVQPPALRLAVIDTGLAIESDLFAVSSSLVEALPQRSRAQRVALLAAGVEAAYGSGLISERQRRALLASTTLLAVPRTTLARYKSELDYLALVPAWGGQRLRFHFGEAVQQLARIEPKAQRFVEDQLRGSPLFFYAEVLDGLLRDANALAGVRKELFGRDVGAGLRALNPGLAGGQLRDAPAAGEAYREGGIYVLPETVADLPPVAGILTAGEGNPLSHVQLLARNLGIPNVGVDEALLATIAAHRGEQVILAVSAAGSVRLQADRGEGRLLFGEAEAGAPALIRPDLEKLDLEQRRLFSLSELRAHDSGRVVGPKAAKLGELKRQFPEAVEEGLAIPFAQFRDLLDASHPQGGSLFAWMQARYRALEAMPAGSVRRREATESFRGELHERVLRADPGDAFRSRLRARMREVFGPDGSYGVFVRSDTNVEDLPGFTGAGLNLTVPNVVGVDAVIDAVSRVWASPFTARAFAWRQAHMEAPEHVYPAVLLLRSVDADKSGVMVTRDVDSGAAGWLSVAVNEGVGGAVDGQAAESLRIHVETGEVRLLAQATAPWRRRLDPSGGVDKVPASGRDRVLGPAEIEQLIALHRVLPQRFPALVDASGRSAPADIEFGFLDGELKLFQIRPFLESSRARGNVYLASLDAGLQRLDEVQVDMSGRAR